jgi:hypothetical protein
MTTQASTCRFDAKPGSTLRLEFAHTKANLLVTSGEFEAITIGLSGSADSGAVALQASCNVDPRKSCSVVGKQ